MYFHYGIMVPKSLLSNGLEDLFAIVARLEK